MHRFVCLLWMAAAGSATAGPAENPASRPAEAPTPPLTLPAALQQALEHHPELAALDQARLIADARVLGAAARPNPELSVELEDALGTGPFSGVDEAQLTLAISQVIELWGRRERRSAVAEGGRRLADLEYQAARLRIISITAGRFLAALAAQEEASLQRETVDLAESFRDIIRQRHDAGSSSAVDLTRADLSLQTSLLDLDLSRRRTDEARRHLASQWGDTELRASTLAGGLSPLGEIPELDDLLERLRDHPDIQRQWAEQQRLHALLTLERLGPRPDVTVDAGYRWLNGPSEHAFVLGFSLPLPVAYRNQGAILETQAALDQSQSLEDAALRGLRAQLTQAWSRLDAARHEVNQIDATLLPLADAAHRECLRFFEQGRFSLLDVLAARRELFALRLRHLRAAVAFHQARLEMDALLGSVPAPERGSDLSTAQSPTQP